MSLQHILENLEILQNTSSTNEKVNLLKTHLKDPLFLQVVKYTLDIHKKYGIKDLEYPKNIVPSQQGGSIREIFDLLSILANKPGTTHEEKSKLANLAASIDAKTFEVVRRIVNKDLKCGVSGKLINKAVPGTIFVVPYMRCSTTKKIENITFPAIIQEKADGMFVYVMINSKFQIKIITRNGRTVYQLDHLKKIILRGRGLPPKKCGRTTVSTKYGILNNYFSKSFCNKVYSGELIVIKDGKILSRQEGNGILNSCIHGTADKEDAQCVAFRCWDSVPIVNLPKSYVDKLGKKYIQINSMGNFVQGEYRSSYNTRLYETRCFMHAVNDPEFVDVIKSKKVHSLKEVNEFYQAIRAAGGEGAVLKNLDSIWKDHTSPNIVKLKNASEAELCIKKCKYGKKGTKYETQLGAIECSTRDGKLCVSVGSGFSDDQRVIKFEEFIGKIATIQFESVSISKNKKEYSLFLPRFVEIREDRDVADSLEDLLKR